MHGVMTVALEDARRQLNILTDQSRVSPEVRFGNSVANSVPMLKPQQVRQEERQRPAGYANGQPRIYPSTVESAPSDWDQSPRSSLFVTANRSAGCEMGTAVVSGFSSEGKVFGHSDRASETKTSDGQAIWYGDVFQPTAASNTRLRVRRRHWLLSPATVFCVAFLIAFYLMVSYEGGLEIPKPPAASAAPPSTIIVVV
jgi:hypothetical protein